MARLPRLVVPSQPHHIIQRGNDQRLVFGDDADYRAFLGWLREASRQYKVAIHAYVLMPNHLHLLATPSDEEGLAKTMQWLGRYYVPYFNRKYQRTGTLWQGRYKTSVIDTEAYFMACSRYIELNPVRANLHADPADYPWSSYRHHIGLHHDPLITEHALYWHLGNTPFEREAAYKDLAQHGLTAHETTVLREAMAKGWSVGSTSFKQQLAKLARRRIEPGKRGRPRKDEVKSDK